MGNVVKFKTESGSNYEIDFREKRARRLSGEKVPTNYQGSDGEWRKFENDLEVLMGERVVFIWAVEPWNAEPDCGLLRVRTTTTSPVKEVYE